MNKNSKERTNKDLIRLVKNAGKEFDDKTKENINPADIKNDLYRIIARFFEVHIKLIPRGGFVFKKAGHLEKSFRTRKNICYPAILQIKEGAMGYNLCLNIYDNRTEVIDTIEKGLNIKLKQSKNNTRYYHQIYLISSDEYYGFRSFNKMTHCLKERINNSGYILKLGEILAGFKYGDSNDADILRDKILKLLLQTDS